MNSKISRRDFLKLVKYFFINSSLFGIGGSIYSTLIEPLWFDIENISIILPRLPKQFSGFRIVQISDIHAGEQFMPDHLDDVVEKILEINPDILVITGDFVDSSERMTEGVLTETGKMLNVLSREIPTFAVMGNHDYWWNVEKVRSMLHSSNIRELRNDFHIIQKEDSKIYLCGVDDFWMKESDLGNILARLPDEDCAILLVHEPDFADKSSKHDRFDLQISGHSHGGQISIPFYGPIRLPRHGIKYHTGLYKVENMYQYTNRGIGMASPYVRFNCRPEITVFTLESLS